MNFDGSKMRGGLGAGVVFTSPKGDKLLYDTSPKYSQFLMLHAYFYTIC
jgi:hypothetical protein